MTTDLEDRLRTQAQKIADEGYHRWSELCVEVADVLGSQADRIQALEAKCAGLEKDAARWREFNKDDVASERALIVRWQEVVKFHPLKSTPAPYNAFEATYQAIYEQQAIREVRLQWVDEEGDQPTLLHMIDATIAAQAGSKEG